MNVPSIVLRRMTPADLDQVRMIEVQEEQRDFVDPIIQVLEAHTGEWENHVVVADGAIIGFFQIDARVEGPRIPGQIEFHEVRIDRHHQGRGYGKEFLKALCPYLVAMYPEASDACLSVNFRNPAAYHVYQSGGFVDTGDVYLDGGAGPQHVMTMPLRQQGEPRHEH